MVIIDDHTIDFYIDEDPLTPENEPFAKYLPRIAIRMFPEHFLNQSQLVDNITPDITHPAWNEYSQNCYGTGLFNISSYIEGVETILTVRPDCWRLNATITKDPTLDWERRFGDFSGRLSQLRIKIIPDLQTSILEFEAGNVDIVDIFWNRKKRLDLEQNPTYSIQKNIHYTFSFVIFNIREERGILGNREPAPSNPLLTKGLAIRKAMCHAINREEINKIMHSGEYHIYNTPIYSNWVFGAILIS